MPTPTGPDASIDTVGTHAFAPAPSAPAPVASPCGSALQVFGRSGAWPASLAAPAVATVSSGRCSASTTSACPTNTGGGARLGSSSTSAAVAESLPGLLADGPAPPSATPGSPEPWSSGHDLSGRCMPSSVSSFAIRSFRASVGPVADPIIAAADMRRRDRRCETAAPGRALRPGPSRSATPTRRRRGSTSSRG